MLTHNDNFYMYHNYRGNRATYAGGATSLHWRHNDHDGVSNHQPRGCLLNRLFSRRSKKTSKLRVIGLCAGNSPGPVNSPHKGPVTRKIFPFDDVIMWWRRHMETLSKLPCVKSFHRSLMVSPNKWPITWALVFCGVSLNCWTKVELPVIWYSIITRIRGKVLIKIVTQHLEHLFHAILHFVK